MKELLLYLIVVTLLVQNGKCCQSRSGMDKYRKEFASHQVWIKKKNKQRYKCQFCCLYIYNLQGKEPSYDNSKKYDLTEEDKKRILKEGKIVSTNVTTRRERGEIKIGDNYLFPIAQTGMGMMLGRVEKSREGNRILAFRGIRHVQPPIGKLRFKPPLETPSWKGLVELKSNGHVCPQHLAHKTDVWVGDEDCLWLNVFTR